MPRRYGIAALILIGLALVASLAFARQSGATQEPVSLAGTVVASDTGQPVVHASVGLNPGFSRFLPPGTGYPYTSVTDDKGEFHFSGVKPGRYAIVVDANHFVDDLNRGSRVLDPGQNVSGLQLAVTPAGTISGKVLDENGKALVRYRVEVLDLTYNPNNGRPELGTSRPLSGMNTETDDGGNYRVSGLLPGKHYVRVLPPGRQKDDEASYPVTYYPSTVDPGQATPVLLALGSESHVDVSLRPGGVHIRGKVVGLDSGARLGRSMLLTLRNTAVDEGLVGRINRSKRERDGEFDFDGITPGSYSLFQHWATADKTSHVSSMVVEVNSKDQNDVMMVLRPGVDIQGRFVVDSSLTVPADFFKRLHVRSKPTDRPDFGPRPSSDVNDQGEFVLKQVDEGRYFFPLLPLFGNAYISEIRLDGRANPDLTFDVTPATHGSLEIHLSAGASILKGMVRDPQNNPVSGAMVVLEPDVPRRSNTSLFKWASTNASGQFVIGVPMPGDYKAFALDSAPPDTEVRSAIFMSKYEAFGKALHIEPGSKSEIDLRVIAAGQNK